MRRQIGLFLLLACTGLPAAVAAERPEMEALSQRLSALRADPATSGVAGLEQMRAQQAVAELQNARSRQRDFAQWVAERRVGIAEAAARAEAADRQARELELKRSELLLEASRREVTRARQETERLRIQAQIQAEEAERLRIAADAEVLARQDAEDLLTTVAGRQTDKLSESRQKEARLARQEAELISGHKLPASRFSSRGEVFTLDAGIFQGGTAKLSSAGATAVAALAAYLQASPKAKATIEGFGNKQTPGQARANALRDALVAAGIPRNRLQAVAKGEGTKARAVELVIAS